MRDIDIWRHELFDVVCTIANPEEIRVLWLGEDPSAISSYEEEVAHVFHDYEIDAFLELEPVVSGITSEQLEALRNFRDAFREFVSYVYRIYGSTPSPQQILDDKKWNEVQKLASKFIESLPSKLGSGSSQ